jgi:hypothetical protein
MVRGGRVYDNIIVICFRIVKLGLPALSSFVASVAHIEKRTAALSCFDGCVILMALLFVVTSVADVLVAESQSVGPAVVHFDVVDFDRGLPIGWCFVFLVC